ncbi:MAG TPA: transcriptional regulator [Flavipsychrobacter sp.]
MIHSRYFLQLLLCLVLMSASANAIASEREAYIDSMLALVPEAKNDTNKVLLLCELSRAYFQVAPDKGVVYGEHALKLSEELGYQHGILKANSALGRCYAVQNNLSLALQYFDAMLSQARNMKSSEDIGNALVSIANVYNEKGEYQKALDHLLKADSAYKEADMNNRYFVMNNIGSVYIRMDSFKQSLPYILEAIRMEKLDKAIPGRLAIAYENAGSAYNMTGEYDKSLYYLFQALDIAEKTGNRVSYANTLSNIGATYLRIGSSDNSNTTIHDSLKNKRQNLLKAIEYSKKALNLSYQIGTPYIRINTFRNMSKIYTLLNNYEEGYRYLNQYIAIKDSINDLSKEKAFAQAEAEFRVRRTTDSLKYANLLKDQEIQKRHNDRNIIIIILCLAGVSALLWVNKQKIRHLQKRRDAEEQLRVLTNNIKEKNELIESISADIAKLQTEGTDAVAESELLLSELQQSILLTDEQWDNFKATFEKVHPGYIVRVKSKLPDLTPAEIRFIVLSKLRLSTREMAGMMGISQPAVRSNKYRLMKKIGVDSNDELFALLETI